MEIKRCPASLFKSLNNIWTGYIESNKNISSVDLIESFWIENKSIIKDLSSDLEIYKEETK
jgi:hypothetical protein